jgi:hypothetical protein
MRHLPRVAAAVVTGAICLGAAAQAGAVEAHQAPPLFQKTLYVSDEHAFGGDGGVIRVNVETGVRTVVSKNNAPAQRNGPDFAGPQRLATSWSSASGTTQAAPFRVSCASIPRPAHGPSCR